MSKKPTYKEKYPHLFSPLVIRGKVIKNRMVSSPFSGGPNLVRAGANGYSVFTEDGADYMGKVARGGAAIVNTGHLCVDPRFYIGYAMERFDFFDKAMLNSHVLPVMHRMTDHIHAYGALASIELNHPGFDGTPVEGNKMYGPSPRKLDHGLEMVEMTEADMEEIATYFAEAAKVGKKGGFDIVNIHAGHGWLIGSFISPLTNKRTDKYGGSVENRARFPKMVLDKVREYVGEDMIIAMRFSASDKTEGGITPEEAVETIKILEETADIVQCTGGIIEDVKTMGFMFPLQYSMHGINVHLAENMKKHTSKAIIETVGGINQPEQAEEILASGKADLVGMARTWISDPDWGEKVRTGNEDEIRPCLRCLRCLNYSPDRYEGTGASWCTVNPTRSMPYALPPSRYQGKNKNVAIVGGGPAGMNAAIFLADKDYNVTLFEKDDKLGGRLDFADHIEFKEDIKRYREYLVNMVTKNEKIDVKLGVDATRETIDALEPDAVVVAVGAENLVPNIKGVNGDNVIHSTDAFGNEDKLGDKVVIVGGGLVGCELAVHLKQKGKRVDLIEMSDELMPDGYACPEERMFTLWNLEYDQNQDTVDLTAVPKTDLVRTFIKSKCVEINENGVVMEDENGNTQLLEADTVIMATGFKINKEVVDQFEDAAFDVVTIGNCKKVGDLYGVTSTAYQASIRI